MNTTIFVSVAVNIVKYITRNSLVKIRTTLYIDTNVTLRYTNMGFRISNIDWLMNISKTFNRIARFWVFVYTN